MNCVNYFEKKVNIQEAICLMETKINEIVEMYNRVNADHEVIAAKVKELEALVDYLLGAGLEAEVKKKLEEWLADGTLADIIGDTLDKWTGRIAKLETDVTSINSQLDDNIQDLNTKITTEKNRIDNLIINSGEGTEKDSELIDARTGVYDTYITLGEHLRGMERWIEKGDNDFNYYKGLDFLRNGLMAFPFDTDKFEINFNTTTKVLKTNGTLICRQINNGGFSTFKIPPIEIVLSEYDVVYVNYDTVKNTNMLNTSDILVGKNVGGFNTNVHIPLFWYNASKVSTNLGFPINYTTDNKDIKICWIGDSISAFKKVPHRVGDLLNANVYDCSFPGGVMCYSGGWRDILSFRKICECIAKKDFTEIDNAITQQEQENPQGWNNRPNYETLINIDFSNITHIVCMMGTNDFTGNIELGTGVDINAREFKSGIRLGIESILKVYPHIQFIFIAPPWRVDAESTTTNQYYKLSDLIQAEKEIVSDMYHFPLFNLYENCGINSITKNKYLVDDVHLSDDGDILLSGKIAKFISVN